MKRYIIELHKKFPHIEQSFSAILIAIFGIFFGIFITEIKINGGCGWWKNVNLYISVFIASCIFYFYSCLSTYRMAKKEEPHENDKPQELINETFAKKMSEFISNAKTPETAIKYYEQTCRGLMRATNDNQLT